MGKEEQFEVLKLKTHVLKVNVHCDGCKIKVKKLLHRIQGVFSVEVDVEKQKVTVQANVDSSTLIKKLTIAGMHAEAWPDNKPSNQAKNNGNNKQQKPGGGSGGGGSKKSKEQQGKQQQQNKVQHKPLASYSSFHHGEEGSVLAQLLTNFPAWKLQLHVGDRGGCRHARAINH